MKKIYLILNLLFFSTLNAEQNLMFFLEKALKNNIELNAERKNFQSAKQSKNISRSEFFPKITVSGDRTNTTSTNRTDQTGANLDNSKNDSQSKKIALEQKIFSGFKGVNTFKKTELETEKAKLELKKVEQQTIFDASNAYLDLIFKSKNEKFNLANLSLFERQVETDNARLQKGEITLTDLAQSESSLAAANANLIKAKTEFLSSKTNFERIIGEKTPYVEGLKEKIFLNLPSSLSESLKLSEKNNIDILISKIDFEISVKKLNIERARLSPSATIEVSKTENNDFSSSVDDKDDETVKATITWPIIKGGENVSAIKKSNFDKQKAGLIFKDIKNKVTTQISNSWSRYQSSKSVLEATKSQLRAAEIANEGISLEYDSGNTRTTLEVIQSRTLLLEARIAFAEAEKDFMVSQFELAKQIGTLSVKSVN